jgi:hypothetical protein
VRHFTTTALALTALLGVTAAGAPAASAGREPAGDVSAAAFSCGRQFQSDMPIALQSVRTGDFVAAELGYDGGSHGMLRARSENINGSWETFVLRNLPGGRVALQNVNNGRYVATELDATGENANALRARSASVGGSWEEFILCHDPTTGYFAFRSAAANRYVAVEADYEGYNANMLRARSTGIGGSWEEFRIWVPSASGTPAVAGAPEPTAGR